MKVSERFPFLNEKLTTGQLMSLAGVLIVFFCLRWNGFTTSFERDEGEYSYSAWLMKQHVMPYEEAFLQKPPMIIYTYMLSQYISEDSPVPPRILAALSLGLSTLLVGIIISRDYGNWVGLATVWLMTPMLVLPALAPYSANTEMFMILPLLGLLTLYNWKNNRATGIHWFLAGVSSAFALLFKPIAVLVVLFIFAVWMFDTMKSGQTRNLFTKFLPLAFAGGLLTTFLIIAPFLFYDSGRTLWECVVQYNFYYVQGASAGQNPFGFFIDVFWKFWWVLFLLLIWFIIKRPRRWWFYGGLLCVSVLTIYTASAGHYYIIIVPFWAMISSISVNSIIQQMKKFFNRNGSMKKSVLLIVIVLLLALPLKEQLFLSPTELTGLLYGSQNPFVEAKVVAQKVANITTPTDKIFIAGSEPEILYYAKRKSTSRFVIVYPMMLRTPIAAHYQNETIQALKDHPPEVIVFARSPSSWLMQPGSPKLIGNYINQLVAKEYHIVGGVTFDTKEWYDKLDENVYNRASMLVYKKNSSLSR